MSADPDDRGDPDLAALRGRLYRPGATEEDVRRYQAARAAAAEQPEPERAAAVLPARRRRPIVVAALVSAALTVVAVGGLRVAAGGEAIPSATPAALPWRSERPARVVRLSFDPALQQFEGRGAGVARLRTAVLPDSEGRLRVTVTLAAAGPVLWTATRVDVGPGSVVDVRVLAEDSRTQRAGDPVPTTFLYAGGPPTAVHVHAPDDVAWSLAVAPMP